MANKYGRPVGGPTNPIALPRIETPGGLTLTKISGGSVRVNDAATGDSLSPANFLVGTQSLIASTVSWATDDLTFTRLLTRAINDYTATSGFWATHDGTDKVLIWPADGRTQVTTAITATGTGFTSTVQNMDVYQAFVAETDWNSGNEGADAFADAGMYRVGFDFAHLYSLASTEALGAWDLTSAKCAELDITTEDQVLSAYLGSKGVHTIGSAAVKKTLAVLGCMEDHISLFLQSAAAQNPVYSLRCY